MAPCTLGPAVDDFGKNSPQLTETPPKRRVRAVPNLLRFKEISNVAFLCRRRVGLPTPRRRFPDLAVACRACADASRRAVGPQRECGIAVCGIRDAQGARS